MVAILALCAAVLIMTTAEVLHTWRIHKVAGLAFGPKRRPALWVYLVPPLRILASGAVAWGLVTLMPHSREVRLRTWRRNALQLPNARRSIRSTAWPAARSDAPREANPWWIR